MNNEDLTIQEPKIIPQEPKIIPFQISNTEKFKYAYEYIQKRFNLKHSIKPCEAVKLVYGVKEGWKGFSLFSLTCEVLRVVDYDREKAFEILKMYYENSEKKPNRTLRKIENQIDYIYRLKKRGVLKISCERLMNSFDCVGKENCYTIRGFQKQKKRCKVLKNQEDLNNYVNSQVNAYMSHLTESGLDVKLSPEAFKIYYHLVRLKFLRGYEWVFVSYKDLFNVLGKTTNKIRLFLNELKNNGLIIYEVEKPSFKEKKAIEVRVLNLFKEPINRIDEMFT